MKVIHSFIMKLWQIKVNIQLGDLNICINTCPMLKDKVWWDCCEGNLKYHFNNKGCKYKMHLKPLFLFSYFSLFSHQPVSQFTSDIFPSSLYLAFYNRSLQFCSLRATALQLSDTPLLQHTWMKWLNYLFRMPPGLAKIWQWSINLIQVCISFLLVDITKLNTW